ncbi:MAG: mechanosensitive ion channel family protein [Actinomycetota bacterium]
MPVLEWIQIAAVATALKIAAVGLIAALFSLVLRRSVRKLEKRVSDQTTPARALQRTQTLAKVLSSAGIATIWVIAFIQMLSMLEWDLAPLLAGVGIIGLALGFGAQSLVKDIVTGFFILLEDQYGVGDNIEINQAAGGKVEQLTLRVTGLRALDGTMHYFPNGTIDHVANRSKDWARAIVDVGVAYKEDPNKVRSVLEEVAKDAKADPILGDELYSVPEILGVEILGEYDVTWRMLADTKPGQQWIVARALREKVKVGFDATGIEIPYPHRVMVTAEAGGDHSDSGSD